MRNFLKNILPLILTFLSGFYKFFKREVLPIIHFINAIKELLEVDTKAPAKKNKAKTKKEIKSEDGIIDFIDWLMNKLNWTLEQIEPYITAFVTAIKTLLPDIITGKTFQECLIQYIMYLKECNKWQLSWTLLKTASLMIIEFSPDKNIKEHQADFLAQTGYTYLKNNKK